MVIYHCEANAKRKFNRSPTRQAKWDQKCPMDMDNTHTNRFWIRHSKYRDATHFALLSIWKKRNQLHRKVLPNEYSYSLVSSVNKVRDAGERCVAQISLETCKRRSRFHTSHLFNMTACLMANLWLFSETRQMHVILCKRYNNKYTRERGYLAVAFYDRCGD